MASENQVYKFYTELPTYAKGVIAIGTLALLAMFGINVMNRIKKDAKDKQSQKAIKSAEDELTAAMKGGMKPTFAPSQYIAWGEQIKTQFAGCDFSSTYYSASLLFASDSFIFLAKIIKQLKNNADWLSLVKYSGVLTYDQCGIGNGDMSGDLYTCIADELNTVETQELNKLLASKGITYSVS